MKKTTVTGLATALLISLFSCQNGGNEKIDRAAVVERNCPVNTTFDALSSLSVGNGEFAFTVDATGLQIRSREYYSVGAAGHTIAMGVAFVPESRKISF